MKSLFQQVTDAGLAEHIFNERQSGEILGRRDAGRYGVVNRALKEGSLIRLKRGTYLLDRRYRREAIHPFAVAQAFLPGSYISFETALAHRGWIPEAVHTTASVTPGRKTILQDAPGFGHFSFHPLAIHDYRLLAGVARERFGALTAFVASPLRALMDVVALRKLHWSGLNWLTDGMRIDETHLLSLRRKDFAALSAVYKHKAAKEFLQSLESALLTIKTAPLEGRSSHD
jgi:hypothetical protein